MFARVWKWCMWVAIGFSLCRGMKGGVEGDNEDVGGSGNVTVYVAESDEA